jgi:Tol biopolymer transport system component
MKMGTRRAILVVTTALCTTVLLTALAAMRHASAQEDRGKIAFHSKRDWNWEIYVMDADGKNPVNLTQHAAGDFYPAWSPDGRRIAFTSHRDGDWEIYVMDADGSNVKRLTNHPKVDDFPAWSPDGKRIAFVSDQDVKWQDMWLKDICVMNADGTNVERITFNIAVYTGLSWAPAQKIAYMYGVNRMDCPVFVMEPDGGNQTRISKVQEWAEYSVWSPDGTKIVYAVEEDGGFDRVGNWEIYVMDANGENRVNLTQHKAYDSDPAWSPDGERIAFTSDRDGNGEIYVMDADGSNVERLTDNPAWDGHPSWVDSSYAIDPSGKLKAAWGKIKVK